MFVISSETRTDPRGKIVFPLEARSESSATLRVGDVRFFDAVAVRPSDRGAFAHRISQVPLKVWTNAIAVRIVKAELRAAAHGRIQTRIEGMVETGQNKVRRGIAKSMLVGDDSKSILADQFRRRHYLILELIPKSIFDAVRERGDRSVIVIQRIQSVARLGGKAPRPRVKSEEFIRGVKVVSIPTI